MRPAGGLEADAAQDATIGVVGEVDVLEPDCAVRHGERLGARPVGDVGALAENDEHHLDVDDRLLDVAVDHAHEIERLVELQHHRIEQHEIADAVAVAAHAVDAHRQHDDHADGEDNRLAGVEHRQRDVSLDAEPLVTRHGAVVARRFARLGAEILDRLEVEQTVDRLGVGVGVALVHRAADADAPVGGDGGVDEVDDDGDGDRNDVAPVERIEERRGNQRELDDRRRGDQHRSADDRLDRIAAAFEHARQPAGLALEMEAQRQLVEMDEHLVGEAADGVHRHGGEQRVAALLGQRHQDAHRAVKRGQRQRAEQRARRRRRPAGGQRIGRPFQRIRRGDRHQFGEDHQHDRQADPRLEVGAVRRPQVGPQPARGAGEGALAFSARARGEEARSLWLMHGVPRRKIAPDIGSSGRESIPARANKSARTGNRGRSARWGCLRLQASC